MAQAPTTDAQNNSADNTDNSATDPMRVELLRLADQALGYMQNKANTTIVKPGKYSARVTTATEYTRNGQPVLILNFAAATQYQVDQANADIDAGLDAIEAGDSGAAITAFTNAGNRGLTTNVRIGRDYEPTVGEYVFVQIEERPIAAKVDPNTGEMIAATSGLFVTSVMAQPPVEPVAINVRASAADRMAKLAGKTA